MGGALCVADQGTAAQLRAERTALGSTPGIGIGIIGGMGVGILPSARRRALA
jgi:hypothetical protein